VRLCRGRVPRVRQRGRAATTLDAAATGAGSTSTSAGLDLPLEHLAEDAVLARLSIRRSLGRTGTTATPLLQNNNQKSEISAGAKEGDLKRL
jgi:hypothetical protein